MSDDFGAEENEFKVERKRTKCHCKEIERGSAGFFRCLFSFQHPFVSRQSIQDEQEEGVSGNVWHSKENPGPETGCVRSGWFVVFFFFFFCFCAKETLPAPF
jgi:hypothetical protein